MPFSAALVMGGTSLLGGVLGGNASRDAANTSARAQLEAARIAAEAAKFRPVGVTTRFGASQLGLTHLGTCQVLATQLVQNFKPIKTD